MTVLQRPDLQISSITPHTVAVHYEGGVSFALGDRALRLPEGFDVPKQPPSAVHALVRFNCSVAQPASVPALLVGLSNGQNCVVLEQPLALDYPTGARLTIPGWTNHDKPTYAGSSEGRDGMKSVGIFQSGDADYRQINLDGRPGDAVRLSHTAWPAAGFAHHRRDRMRLVEINASATLPIALTFDFAFQRQVSWYNPKIPHTDVFGRKSLYRGEVLTCGPFAVPIDRPTGSKAWQWWDETVGFLRKHIGSKHWPFLIQALEGQYFGEIFGDPSETVARILQRVRALTRKPDAPDATRATGCFHGFQCETVSFSGSARLLYDFVGSAGEFVGVDSPRSLYLRFFKASKRKLAVRFARREIPVADVRGKTFRVIRHSDGWEDRVARLMARLGVPRTAS